MILKNANKEFSMDNGDNVNYVLPCRKFRSSNILRILKSLCSGPKRFSQLKRETQLNDALLLHYLRKLLRYGIITREAEKTYKLRFKVPICYLFLNFHPCTYLGFLGLRQEREIPEPIIALNLLRRLRIIPTKNYIFTTSDALASWKGYELSDFSIKLLSKDDLLDIDAIEERVERVVIEEAKTNLLIMDCTSLTKTATIAMYNLARRYYIPLIYVYEETKELVWLIDIETVKREVISKIVDTRKERDNREVDMV